MLKDVSGVSQNLPVGSLDLDNMVRIKVLLHAVAGFGKSVDVIGPLWGLELVIKILVVSWRPLPCLLPISASSIG